MNGHFPVFSCTVFAMVFAMDIMRFVGFYLATTKLVSDESVNMIILHKVGQNCFNDLRYRQRPYKRRLESGHSRISFTYPPP